MNLQFTDILLFHLEGTKNPLTIVLGLHLEGAIHSQSKTQFAP